MNEEILKRLDVLAAKLGVTAQMLWDVLVRQARIEAIVDTCLTVVFIAGLALYAWFMRRYIAKWQDSYPSDAEDMVAIVGGFAAAIVLIITICLISASVTEWINPQYWALKQILDAAK